MKKTFYLSLFTAALLLSGCLTTEKNNPVVTYKSTEINGKTVSSGIISPSNIAQFSDIPIPEGAVMNTDSSVIMGSGDSWTGRLIYSAPYAANAVFEFYLSEMPKFGWTEITVVRSKVNQMIYQQGMRIANIQMDDKGSDKSEVFFMVSPPSKTTSANNPTTGKQKVPNR